MQYLGYVWNRLEADARAQTHPRRRVASTADAGATTRIPASLRSARPWRRPIP
ncbi:MAG: hypothetical protein KDB63_02400 [Nocardioidaceae bacterium]|nr:hypothetical protein [Nocardioidaceae bacterium]